MGLRVDKAVAAKLFAEALELAQSDSELPAEWLEHTARLAGSSKTFTSMLGTALLAKATNRQVSAFALQKSEGHKGYSARTLAKDVLVPQCVMNGIDLRTGGAEPLNNSPFYREERVSEHLTVKERDQPDLAALCEALAAADFLEGRNALEALAAFLRSRIELGERPAYVSPGSGVLSAVDLADATRRFIDADPEGGRRGQAFVAACLDLVFADIRAGAINDPSVRVPGDVLVPDRSGQITLSAEVKQKPVVASEILQFTGRLARTSVARGLYAALSTNQPPLDSRAIEARSLEDNGVLLTVISEPERLLHAALLWSGDSLDLCLARFPKAMGRLLVAFGCRAAASEEWAALFAESARDSSKQDRSRS